VFLVCDIDWANSSGILFIHLEANNSLIACGVFALPKLSKKAFSLSNGEI
jgi:hypothetical protein